MKIINISLICLLFLTQAGADDEAEIKNFIENRLYGVPYTGDTKCATRYLFGIRESSPELQSLAKIAFPPDTVRDRSLITPKGHFRLSWDESGENTVPIEDISGNGYPDFIDSAAVIFDHVWEVEINQMGYPPPPDRDGNPATIYYVYFTNLDAYGYTYFDYEIPNLPGQNYYSFMEIDNDFSGFYSSGIAGLKVTAAHEFHHAIQFGYNVRSDDLFFYEMTSTWMEDLLYPEINDYYDYLNPTFQEISNKRFDYYSKSSSFPYGNSIYLKLLEIKYGRDIVRQIWEKIRTQTGMNALINTLQESPNLTPWQESLNEYGAWLYYTGSRAQTGRYFPDAANYPEIVIKSGDKIEYDGGIDKTVNLNPLANRYFEFSTISISELDIVISSPGTSKGGVQLLTPSQPSGFIPLNKPITSEDISSDAFVLLLTNSSRNDNNFNISQPTMAEIAISRNPVIVSEGLPEVQFKVPQDSEIYIFTVSGQLVTRLDKDESQMRSWDLKNQIGEDVASGVYLYLVKGNNLEELKKFSIIR